MSPANPMPLDRRPHAARAFTLIEILAVLVVLGLLTGAVTVTLGHAARRGTFQNTMGAVAFADQTARRAALQRHEPQQLIFDASNQEVRRHALSTGDETTAVSLSAARLECVRFFDRDDDRATIDYTRDGHSATYALHFTAPPDQSAWVVVVGLTGQTVTMDSEDEVDALFTMLGGGEP